MPDTFKEKKIMQQHVYLCVFYERSKMFLIVEIGFASSSCLKKNLFFYFVSLKVFSLNISIFIFPYLPKNGANNYYYSKFNIKLNKI